MIVLKQGTQIPDHAFIDFECDRCGCRFKADNYSYDSRIINQETVCHYTRCPNCTKTLAVTEHINSTICNFDDPEFDEDDDDDFL